MSLCGHRQLPLNWGSSPEANLRSPWWGLLENALPNRRVLTSSSPFVRTELPLGLLPEACPLTFWLPLAPEHPSGDIYCCTELLS